MRRCACAQAEHAARLPPAVYGFDTASSGGAQTSKQDRLPRQMQARRAQEPSAFEMDPVDPRR